MCDGDEFAKTVQLGFQVLVAIVMIGLILWGFGWLIFNFYKPILILAGGVIAVVGILWGIGAGAKFLDKKLGEK